MRKHVQNNGFWKEANFEYLQSTPEGYVARVFHVCWRWKRGEAKASQTLNEEERWFTHMMPSKTISNCVSDIDTKHFMQAENWTGADTVMIVRRE